MGLTSLDATNYKSQAVECWTLAPCGPAVPDFEPGSRRYFERLVALRRAYAPWMADAFGYATARGLDVLDVGCGQGIDLFEYASQGARITGIDLTPRHVGLARAHLASMGIDVAVQVDDAETMHLPDGSFDRVSSNGVLHHTPDIGAAFRECLRVLRPGGEFVATLYNEHSFHYWGTQVLGHGLLEGRLIRLHSMRDVLSATVEGGARLGARPLVRVSKPTEVRRMLASAGFTSVRVYKQHFRMSDVRLPLPDPPKRVLELLGRIGGWYLVGTGLKPG